MTADLHFFTADLVGYLVATLVAVPLLLAPGALAARALAQVRPETDWRAFAPALAVALFPLLDALTIRVVSLEAAIAVRLALLVVAVTRARAFLPRPSALAIAGAVLWWLYLAAMYLDVDVGGRLYQSITALDLVKHAAVVREISSVGLPLADPFYARPAPAGYYHYFYDGAAMIDRLGGPVVSARMAFCGAAFACGLAFASFLRAMVIEFGAWHGSSRRLTAFTIVACSIGGFDLIGLAVRWQLFGLLERNPEWWDDEISFFPTSAAWVPHHLAGVIACFVALLLLTKSIEGDRRRGIMLASTAGLAMACGFGLSIWVALGAAAVIALALRTLARGERLKWCAAAAVAAAVALLVSILQISDLLSGRSIDAGPPIALWLREPARIGELIGYPINPLLSVVLTPPVLLLEFGPLALGAWLFWRDRAQSRSGGTLGRVLLASAIGGLLINLLFRSAIINNDFGWRVIWFAAFPALVWSITALQRPLGRATRAAVGVALALGLSTTAYAVVAARIPPTQFPEHSLDFINDDPQIDLALRRAYEWANHNLGPRELLQHNPAAAPRALDFGLYGRNPTMVADYEAELFGPTEREVHGRAFYFGQIFAGERSLSDAQDVHLVVTDRDPLWRSLNPRLCLYRARHVCITRKPQP